MEILKLDRLLGTIQKGYEDPDIDLDDKFQYLLQSLKPVMSARELVKSFPPSGNNYENALEQLKSRLGAMSFLSKFM